MSEKNKWSFHCHPYVFGISAALILAFVFAGIAFTEDVSATFGDIQNFIVTKLGWLYILSVAFFLVFVVGLLFTSYADIRLGKDDEEPEFSRLSWFSMLFSAGMGIGLLFWSVAEPVYHFSHPPPHTTAEAGSLEAAREAINVSYFHWGLHAWGIYILLAMALAYFGFRHDLPLTLRSTLYPLIGERVHGPIGNVVDILAVFGTLFGLATSLGLGVMQINAGLDYLDIMEVSTGNQIGLIIGITLCATASVVSGVHKGIRRLSEMNLLFGLLLAIFVFSVGPTVFLLEGFVQSLGHYTSTIVETTFRTHAMFVDSDWQSNWTMFYWGWWISWSPFVGMFVARISRGRTIREFVIGVLLVPTLVTFLWIGIFGNTAIHMEMFASGEGVGIVEAVSDPDTVPTAMFMLLKELPLSAVSAVLATVVVATFFVTSSDSASLVVDILTAGGDPDPPIPQRVFWAMTEGAVAAVLLWAGKEAALEALQTATITTGLPLCIILLVISYSLIRGLRAEVATRDPLASMAERRREQAGALPEAGPVAAAASSNAATAQEVPPPDESTETAATSDWRSRLQEIIEGDGHLKQAATPKADKAPTVEQTREQVSQFIDQTVVPAFQEIRRELHNYGRDASIEKANDEAAITVTKNGEEEFSYAIRGHAYHKLSFAYPQFDSGNGPEIYQAEVVLRSGQQQPRAVKSFSRESIIEDFLDEYAKWMGW